MMELTAGNMMTIIVMVVVLAMTAVVGVVAALFHSLNAKHESFRAELNAHQEVMNTKMESIQTAVAAGAEEHKTWHAALDKTNNRLDQRQAASDKTNARLDQLLMHLLERKN